MSRSPEELSEEDRERLRLAHHRLRKASQELEALVATKQLRGRWAPTPAPVEVLEMARHDLERAWREVTSLHAQLLGWPEAPG